MSTNDKTLLDNNRTDLSFLRSDIGNVLPDHFKTDYPNLIKLFEAFGILLFDLFATNF